MVMRATQSRSAATPGEFVSVEVFGVIRPAVSAVIVTGLATKTAVIVSDGSAAIDGVVTIGFTRWLRVVVRNSDEPITSCWIACCDCLCVSFSIKFFSGHFVSLVGWLVDRLTRLSTRLAAFFRVLAPLGATLALNAFGTEVFVHVAPLGANRALSVVV
jgi:hypothetical protein